MPFGILARYRNRRWRQTRREIGPNRLHGLENRVTRVTTEFPWMRFTRIMKKNLRLELGWIRIAAFVVGPSPLTRKSGNATDIRRKRRNNSWEYDVARRAHSRFMIKLRIQRPSLFRLSRVVVLRAVASLTIHQLSRSIVTRRAATSSQIQRKRSFERTDNETKGENSSVKFAIALQRDDYHVTFNAAFKSVYRFGNGTAATTRIRHENCDGQRCSWNRGSFQ